MGGKALNRFGVQTERKNTEEFLKIGKEIQEKISITIGIETAIVKCYYSKTTHGDLDLLIRIPIITNINWMDYIQNIFKPHAVNANGGVYSFDYQNFQIDFILINEKNWNIAQTYMNFDCIGNIMGKTFHKFGLSYGWEGLAYKFRNFNGRNSQDILISKDAKKIFDFGGYDYDGYLNGFETLEDIFKFCIDGKYFDSEMFKIENLNRIDRKRNIKRSSYNLFLNYLKDNNINTKYDFNPNKETYLPIINQYFPEAKFFEQLVELQKIDSRNKIISQKFNGDLVMSWLPELKGKELGNAISKFKNSLDFRYEDFILHSSYDEIHNYFMNIYNEKP